MSMGGHSEPNALLVEGHGYVAAVYSIPDMQLLGRKALSLQVTRVFATPDCLGTQRGKVRGARFVCIFLVGTFGVNALPSLPTPPQPFMVVTGGGTGRGDL